ncbi:hypothetical protein C0993_000003 [Termitomyces sp. T159_Od127]|nr:hypothetical protein C0993_000003 [Termitomyces sp. T159_Od127]
MERDSTSRTNTLSRREFFHACQIGTAQRPAIPRLRSDPPPLPLQPPHTLQAFRDLEGRENRKRRLQELWKRLPRRQSSRSTENGRAKSAEGVDGGGMSHTKAEKLRAMHAAYDDELLGHCGAKSLGAQPGEIPWKQFKEYAEAKEVELWSIFHDELDLDGDGHLDAQELSLALDKAGINLSQTLLSDFITTLTSSPHSQVISFAEFRDFLLLLPRKASPAEIYQYYEVSKFMGDDGRGPARLTMEGDALLSAEDRPPFNIMSSGSGSTSPHSTSSFSHQEEHQEEGELYDDDEHESHGWLDNHSAIKFLLAGGVAGAVSRTCTAPFDRLKIFLITRPPDLGGAPLPPKPGLGGMRTIGSAVARIYAEGGVFAFWTGNGFQPSSLPSLVSTARGHLTLALRNACLPSIGTMWMTRGTLVVSAGFSQVVLEASPVNSTQMMSNTSQQKRTLIQAARHVWSLGGARAFYRGLGIGLVGVFPYSAIDMSTFEALKLAYLKSTGKDEPGVMALLAFGSISGSVGATSVYPLNLVRTRLQASGSSGHPQRYSGVADVAVKTWERDGWRGFYRGLFPTLAKVVPAVSISYVVYEHTKQK